MKRMMLSEYLEIKKAIHRLVLNAIRIRKEVSGAELARMIKLQPSTIVYILRSLEKAGLIEVSRLGSSLASGGKPPTLWRLVAEKGYIIGIEIIPNEIRATVIDFACNIIHQQIKCGLKNFPNEKIASSATKFSKEIIKKLKLPMNKIIGVSVALPGLVDRKQGMVNYSVPLCSRDLPLQMMLQDALKLPVVISNDANAGSLGIQWFNNTTKKPACKYSLPNH